MFQQGDRVFVKSLGEVGTVNYVRMGGPHYNTPEVYSVKLDREVIKRGSFYAGSIIKAADVEKYSGIIKGPR